MIDGGCDRALSGVAHDYLVPQRLQERRNQRALRRFLFDQDDASSIAAVRREHACPSHGLALWRENLFVLMARNAVRATGFFRLPPERVVELGVQVEI